MIIILEGLGMCFILLIICVIGIADGPVGMVYLYEKDVQKRVVDLGVTTKKEVDKNAKRMQVVLIGAYLIYLLAVVYGLNGARGFLDGFWQMSVILLIMGMFDRLFIDWYWVGHTKAWLIPGTEDLLPYIPARALAAKWVITVIGYPAMAAALSGIMTLFVK